jgi:superfamily II DNA or RNA helicase
VKPVAIFGLTATLQLGQKETRLKAYAFAGPVIFRFPIEEGVKRGVLSKGYVLQLLFPDVDESGNDYQTDLALQVTQNELKLSACVALTNELMRMDRHELILVDRVSHLHDVDDMLKHIPHGLAYGEIKIADRRQVKENFEDDDIKLLIANKVFKKGTSIKRIDAMIDMAEGKSKNDPIQKYGRGIRLHDGKDELLYIDFGTQGHGRFASAATSRRRALKKAGISVTTARVNSEAEAVLALKKFSRKVGINCHESKHKD